MTLSPLNHISSYLGRLFVAIAVAAAALTAVPGSVTEAAAQTGVCPVGTTLGTTTWGTGGMVWNNDAVTQLSGASQTYNNVAGQVDMTLSYLDPDNVNEDLDNPYLNFVTGDSWDGPVYTQTNGTYGSAFFTIVMNSLNSDQTVDWSFGFSKPVYVPDFTVSDVDWAGYGYNTSGIGMPHESFQDEVVLAGQRGGNAIATTSTGGSGITDLGNGRLAAGPYVSGVNGNVGPTDAAGTVSLTTVGPVTSFNMQYSNGPDDAAADALDGTPPAPIPANSPGVSNNHAVAISNFTVCAGNLRFGDLVWADIDGDGIRDAGEPGIPGVVVSISDPDGNVVETQTTDANGAYEFEQFPGFTWVVSIAAPAGYTSTYDRDGGDLGSTNINPTTNEFDIDFGLQPDPGTISGSVFTDLDNDGVFTAAQQEVALPGVAVDLTGQDLAGNTVTASTTTAADGSYTFTGVPAGTYQVVETQPAIGFTDGIDTAGTNATANGNDQHEVTLGPLESSIGNNFAEVPTSSISGTVYEDADDSATIGLGEAGIGSVPITVAGTDIYGNAVTFNTTTAADGTYAVAQLVAGTYSVTETAQPTDFADGQESVGSAGGTIATESITGIPLGPDEDATDYDFGEIPTSSIAGRVTDETGAAIGGVAIELSGTDDLGDPVTESTTTAADGTYSFIDLRPGVYTVTETQPAAYGDGVDSVGSVDGSTVGTLGNDVLSDIVITVGDNGVNYDFVETLGSIAGEVTDDGGNPIAGVIIDLSGTDANGQPVTASTTTAADGSYEFDDLVGGTYTVTETQPTGYGDGGETAGSAGGDASSSDAISAISLGGGVDATGYDFDETRGSLSGQVFVDPDNDGDFTGVDSPAPGVTVTLSGTDVLGNTVNESTTTAADGTYTFGGLIAGTYQIDEAQPAAYVDGIDTVGSEGGNATVNDRFSAISLGAGLDGTGYDFAELPPAGVAGTVTDSNGDPISGVTLTLTGTSTFGTSISETTTTAADGSYSFFDLPPGTYTVTETQPVGYGDGLDAVGTVGGATVGTLGNDVISDIVLDTDSIGTGYDFTETFASIAGTVVDDDGSGIAGVTITLTGTDDRGDAVSLTTTTAGDGTYSFDELLSGTYTVTETQPIAYGDGGETAGTSGGDDSAVNDQISSIALSPGVDATGYDFDETRSSLRGRVYEDSNNNGASNSGEPRIAGAAITLTGTDVLGNAVSRSTTTNASGNYRFDDLLAGTYTVAETQPAGYVDGIDTPGSTGGDASVNDEFSAIVLPAGQVANGYFFGEILPSSISGTVFVDDNDNGVQNGSDVGINGVTVALSGTDDLGNPVTAATTTAADGAYSFDDLRPGTYTVTETQPAVFLDGSDSAGTVGGTVANDTISAITLPTNTDAIGYDFGELEGASISGAVVDDGGNPIESVLITLTGTDDLGNSVTATTTTAANGTYSFNGLRPGTYTVTETQPAAYGDGGQDAGSIAGTTTGDDTSVNDQISGIVLPAAASAINYDFDETRGSLAGVVFEDTNNDGARNAGESGIAGVSVRITGVDATGTPIDLSTSTSASGAYSFDSLLAGTYTVTETQPTAYFDGIDTPGTSGGVTTTNDRLSSISLAGGANSTANNFGEILPSSIAGTVVDDAGTGIPGVAMALNGTDDLGNPVTATTTTAANGTYSFNDLRPGTYTVTETQPAGYLDGIDTAGTIAGVTVGDASVNDVLSAIVLPSDSAATGYDFDEIRASSISGTVVDDAGDGIAGVAVALSGTDDLGNPVTATATTAANGNYSFNGLRPGTYTVTETQPAAYGDGGETAGTIAGVTVGDASVDDVLSAINLPANTDAVDYDFDETRGSIAGTVYEDTNNNGTQEAGEPGISGVDIELTGTDVLGNPVTLTTTTAADGSYNFGDLLAGTYAITETQPAGFLDGVDSAGTAGGTVGPDEVTAVSLAGGNNATGYDFGELVASSIDGTVFDDDNDNGTQQAGEAGIGGVTLDLTGTNDLGTSVSISTITAGDGTYSFDNLRPGTYTVTETQPAAFLDGTDTAGTIAGVTVGDASVNDVLSTIALPSDTDATGYDFGEIEASSIAGTVVDDGGSGIAGVAIALSGTDDLGASVSVSTVTASDGTYSFDGLRPGTYTVTETQPAAYGDGGETAGTASGDDSADDVVSAIALGAEEDATGYDFDETRGSIAGTVYEDLNGNGTQEAGEPGISGVDIELTGTDANGNPVSLSTTTAGNGDYNFDDLLNGSYTVTETQPAGYADGQESIGSAGGTNAVDDQLSLALTDGDDATGYDFGEVQAGSIAGTVVDDAGDGIPAVTITLTGTDDLGASVSVSTVTAVDGTYSFGNLRPGTYTVTETQPAAYGDGGETAGTIAGVTVGNDSADDTISSITLASGEDATGYDFDETRGSIAGTVYEDTNNDGTQNGSEPGIAGVDIELTGTDTNGDPVTLNTTTAADGSYNFDNLLTGTYAITETQPSSYLDGIDTAGTNGGTVGPDAVTAISLAGGTDATSYDFGEILPSSIAGNVVDDLAAGIDGVTITLTGTNDLGDAVSVSTATAGDGTYSFNGLRPGTYAVTETQPAAYLDGGETAGTIAGVTVGDDTTNDEISSITLASDEDATGYDFDELVASSIAGSVVDDGGTGIAGVTITLTGTDELGDPVSVSTITAGDGTYEFGGLRAGTYTVTETQPTAYGDGGETAGTASGNASTDDVISAIALPARTDATGYDFDETRGSITGTVYEDLNGNGAQNGSEPGIGGVDIELTGTDVLGDPVTLTTTTAADGSYNFGDLLAGTYTVTETQPLAFGDGQETIGSGGGTNAINDEINAISLTGGNDATGYDFGEVQASSIAGTVVDDAGDGINGVTITLTGTDDLGASVTANTTTAADGTYGFNGLRPGDYTVTETQPAAYGDGGETAGTAGGNDSTDDVISGITLASDEDATGYDFDETRGSITGTVYEDLNGNGTQQAGEPGISVVDIELTGTDVLGNPVTLTTTTAVDGSYEFSDLLNGSYSISEDQPVGYLDGGESIGTAGGTASSNDQLDLALSNGDDATGYDFGEVQAGSIAGTVVDDAGDGINGVTITLNGTDDLGTSVSTTTTTAANGTYSFDGLRPGTYTVTETQPTAYGDGGETAGTAGGNASTDDEISGITLSSGEDTTDYDFDETRGSIAGVVFEDTNNNGTQQASEPGISGADIELTGTDANGDSVTLTTTTAANGSYVFTDLLAGTYTVTETQPSSYLDGIDTAGTNGGTAGADTVTAISLTGGDNTTGYTFGEVLPSSIAGSVVDDLGAAISGVTITLTGTDDLGATVSTTTTTAANGSYDFDGLRPGTYTVTETQPTGFLDGGEDAGTAGGTTADDEISSITLASDEDATGYDFDELVASSIAGSVVDDDGNPIAGVTITLTGTDDLGASVSATTTTIADGSYSFDNLRPGTYAVAETQPTAYGDGGETAGTAGGDDSVDDEISAIALGAEEDAAGYDFDEARGSIAGTVYEDLNGNGTQEAGEPGISGVDIELTGSDVLGNPVTLTTTTAANGSYAFGDLLAGSYAVTETQPAGYADGQESIGAAGGTNATNDEINAISLPGGNDATGYDFGEVQAGSIAGTVVDDAGDGIPGVTITLTGTDDLGASVSTTATTAVDGTYSFGNLRPGTYTVTETQPAAYGDGGETAGTIAGVTVGNDSADDTISSITLASGEDATGYDFDETRGSIAGTVYEDTNNNGTQNGSEPGISGVDIELTGTDVLGNPVTLTTTTAADGSYNFGDLLAGTYTVTETQPVGYLDGIDTAGTIAGVTVGDASTNDEITSIALVGGASSIANTFGELLPSSIAGIVVDDDSDGINGVTVALTGTDDLGDSVNTTTTTAANGAYSFTGLRPGTYTVTETQPTGYLDGGETAGTIDGVTVGDDSADDVITTVTLPSNTDAIGYDFDEIRASSISGTVVDDDSDGINGVTVTLTGTDDLGASVTANTTTAADGTYIFDGLRPGTYTVTETQPAAYGDGGEDAGTIDGAVVGSTTDDAISAIALPANTDAVDYDFDETHGSIAGVVFEDTNNNGTQQAGEPGISGVDIELTGTDVLGNPVTLTTTTAANGSYNFGDLLAGTYAVTETQPSSYLDGIDTAGTNGGTAGADTVTAISLTGGDNTTGYTFGEVLPSSIAGTVVDDGGNGIAGATITLTGTDDLGATVSTTTTTAANGSYDFDGLRPGTYTVTETQPTGYLDGGEDAGTAGGVVTDDQVTAIDLASATDATGYDFDEIRASSISGTVVDDAGDGINGVTITLTGTDDLGASVTANTTTLADGTYSFDDLRPGTYTVTETQPAGYGDGSEDAGTSGGVVSDDQVTAISVAANTSATGYDFDETRGSVAGTVYEDLNGNGVQDGSEPGLVGVAVALNGTDDAGNTISLSTATAADGSYNFGDLLSGTYTITETQPAGYLDAQETIGSVGGSTTTNDEIVLTLGGGIDSAGYNFGEVQAASLAGTVYIDSDNSGSQNGLETGVVGAVVTLTGTDDLGASVNASTTTGVDGGYSFDGLRPGTYTVTETQPASLSDGIDSVGSAGGTLANDVVSNITLESAENATGYDFGEIEGASISGTVVDDAGTGIPGTTLTLSGVDDLGDPVTASTTTGADGSYTFTGLRPGTYTVTESQPTGYGDGGETAGSLGGVVTNDSISAITIGSGQSGVGYDFDETRASISGSVYLDADGNGVRDGSDTGLAGVPVELTGTDAFGAAVTRSTTTGSDGSFTFDELISGTYTVSETAQPAGLVDGLEAAGTSGGTVGNDTITGIALAPGVDATGYTFGEWNTSTIGGSVVDELGNPIPGVTLTLTGVEDDGDSVTLTATTGPTGAYTFTNLEPGTYNVAETQPAAYGDGGETAGTVNSSATGTATNDLISGIVLVPNGVGVDYDFIETLGSVSGTVFEDTNGNGTLDGELGIAGVTLNLSGTDANGTAVTATTTTATDGTYTFDDIVGGVYTIQQLQPAGYLDGAETVGSAGGSSTVNDVISGISTSGGDDDTGYDFGEIDAASISGSVVDDGGNPIAGVTITLTGTDDLGATVNLTTTTDATGVYSFNGLRPGTYTVAESQPAGYGDGGQTAGPVGGTVTDDQIADIVLGPNTDAAGNDFDETRSVIGGRVFEDLNSSGTANTGEPGINGVTINLTGTDVLGAPVDLTTTTSGDGDFVFAGLIAGDYTITEVQPAAFADGDDTVGSAGGNGALQNDVVSSIALGAGVTESGYLFGEVAPVSVSGLVFNDSNNDGSAAGETGISGVTVSLSGLDDRGQLVNTTTTTESDGSYSFDDLRPGVYTVTESQPAAFLDGVDTVGDVDGTATGSLGADQITGVGMTSGQNGSGYNFGELAPSSLGGSVVDDLGRPIAGVTIVLTGTDDLGDPVSASTTTAVNGSYSFDDLRPGSYTITESQPAAYGDGGETAGTISTTTIGLENDDEISAIVLGQGSAGIGYDFDEITASISGQVFIDNDGDTVPSTGDTDQSGVAVQLTGSDVNGDPVTASTTTASDGTYTFDGLLAGTYTVTETQPAGLLDSIDTAGTSGGSADNSAGGDQISGIALAAGIDSTGNDFGEVEAGSISGSVTDDGGNGIGGVTITLTGTDLFGQPVIESTTTGVDGSYTFTDLVPGTYAVTESQPLGYGDGGEDVGTIDGVATDDEITAITVLSGQDGTGYDFDETRMSVSGTVVIDEDNDGIADAGETPIDGVTIDLSGTDALGAAVTASTTTGVDGTYTFDGLLAGIYTVTETQPADFLDGAETAGSAGGTVGADSISSIDLVAGVDATDYDFGELEPASLSGSVVDDLGRPIPDVTITLTGTDDLGGPVITTATTGADGTYVFDDLRPGTYTITETQPVAYGDGDQTAGTTGGTVSDDQIADITLGSGDTGTGYDFDETTGSLAGSVVHVTGAGDGPIAGVAVELTGTDLNGELVNASTTTAADGSYEFDGLLAGNYTISETQPAAFADGPERIGTAGGNAATNDEIAAIALGAGIDADSYDFTETGTVLSGRVLLDRTGDGVSDPTDDLDLSGIVIELVDPAGNVVATTTTAADGTYLIGGLLAGDYIVRQTQPTKWGSISPNDLPVNLPVTGLANFDFVENAASISGTVFNDADTDGLDDESSPEAGVTVTLSDASGVIATTTTEANGNYTFAGLPAAEYEVVVDSPADSTFTVRDAGADDSVDSDVDLSDGSVNVSLPAGVDIVDVDAGLVEINRDLAIVITTPTTSANVGDEVIFTTTVTNSGNTVIEGGVTVTIPVPPNTTFVSASGQGWTIEVTDGVLTATRPGTLVPGEEAPPITFVVEPVQAGSINVTGQVVSSSGLAETTTSNNVSSVPITVNATTTTSIPNLAYTGGSALLLLLIAGGLIFSGQALTLIGGRRKDEDDD